MKKETRETDSKIVHYEHFTALVPETGELIPLLRRTTVNKPKPKGKGKVQDKDYFIQVYDRLRRALFDGKIDTNDVGIFTSLAMLTAPNDDIVRNPETHIELTVKEIAAILRLTEKTLAKHLTKLAEIGLVELVALNGRAKSVKIVSTYAARGKKVAPDENMLLKSKPKPKGIKRNYKRKNADDSSAGVVSEVSKELDDYFS